MAWVIPDFQMLLAWWYYWRQVLDAGGSQLVIYTSNEPILHQQTSESDYVTHAGDGFPQDITPYGWSYSVTYTGVATFDSGEIEFTPTLDTPVSGWLIVDKSSRVVLMGERIFAPPQTVKGGDTLKIRIKETLSDHGPPCPGE